MAHKSKAGLVPALLSMLIGGYVMLWMVLVCLAVLSALSII